MQRRKVAAIQRRIANSRRNFHHEASAFIVGNFDTIGVEDLAVKNMSRNRSLARSIADAGWSQFLTFLAYKSEWYGRELRKVGRFYPSSKSCGECRTHPRVSAAGNAAGSGLLSLRNDTLDRELERGSQHPEGSSQIGAASLRLQRQRRRKTGAGLLLPPLPIGRPR